MSNFQVGDYCCYHNIEKNELFFHKIIDLNSIVNGKIVTYSFLHKEVRHFYGSKMNLIKIHNPRLLNIIGIVYEK